MSVTNGEKNGIQVTEGEVTNIRAMGGNCLVGKIWAEKNVNKEAFKSLLSNLWQIFGGVKFKELHDNLWLFEFSDRMDKKRIMDGKPWSFDR
jgi:hypothetical protein